MLERKHSKTCLAKIIIIEIGWVTVLFRKILVAVEANVFTNVDTHQKVFTRHICGKYKVFINLFNQLREISLLQLTLQNKCTMDSSRSEMNVNSTQTIVTLQAVSLHNIVPL